MTNSHTPCDCLTSQWNCKHPFPQLWRGQTWAYASLFRDQAGRNPQAKCCKCKGCCCIVASIKNMNIYDNLSCFFSIVLKLSPIQKCPCVMRTPTFLEQCAWWFFRTFAAEILFSAKSHRDSVSKKPLGCNFMAFEFKISWQLEWMNYHFRDFAQL